MKTTLDAFFERYAGGQTVVLEELVRKALPGHEELQGLKNPVDASAAAATNLEDFEDLVEAAMDSSTLGLQEGSAEVPRCKKCRGNRLSVFGRQTRSADEGTTMFQQCLECGYTEKI